MTLSGYPSAALFIVGSIILSGTQGCKNQSAVGSSVKDATTAAPTVASGLGLSEADACGADESVDDQHDFYMVIFSIEDSQLGNISRFQVASRLQRASYSHSFAAFVKVGKDADPTTAEVHSINWDHPRGQAEGVVCVDNPAAFFGAPKMYAPDDAEQKAGKCLIVTGSIQTYKRPLDVARPKMAAADTGPGTKLRIDRRGPFAISAALYSMAVKQAKLLHACGLSSADASPIKYLAVDTSTRPAIQSDSDPTKVQGSWAQLVGDLKAAVHAPIAINCFHAISDLDQTQGTLSTADLHGSAASDLVFRHLAKWLVKPQTGADQARLDQIAAALGIADLQETSGIPRPTAASVGVPAETGSATDSGITGASANATEAATDTGSGSGE